MVEINKELFGKVLGPEAPPLDFTPSMHSYKSDTNLGILIDGGKATFYDHGVEISNPIERREISSYILSEPSEPVQVGVVITSPSEVYIGNPPVSGTNPNFTFNNCTHFVMEYPCSLCAHENACQEAVNNGKFYPDPEGRLQIGELGVIIYGKGGEFTTVKYLGVSNGQMHVMLRDGALAHFSPKDYSNIAIVKANTQEGAETWGQQAQSIKVYCQGEEDDD